MVAYSFQEQFADAITSGTKRQTVRGYRRRNPRIGEKLQLFANLRKRTCRKLIEKDPICTRVDEIEIEFSQAISAKVASIVINGIPLNQKRLTILHAPTVLKMVRSAGRLFMPWAVFLKNITALERFTAWSFIGVCLNRWRRWNDG